MKTFSILLALLFSARCLLAQETQSPLHLYISGSGRIVPFHDGEMLDDGREFVMTAVPDRGYVFTNWQEINIFTLTEIEPIPGTGQFEVVTSTIPSPTPPLPGKNRVLHFTMEPEEVLADDTNYQITLSHGWQANFVPAPKRRDRGQNFDCDYPVDPGRPTIH
jgi:Divergent InlB B-repeat domain